MQTKYAVFIKTSRTIPGDQRSRDFPGHGYPEHTVESTEVIEFTSEKEFTDWIHKEEGKILRREAAKRKT